MWLIIKSLQSGDYIDLIREMSKRDIKKTEGGGGGGGGEMKWIYHTIIYKTALTLQNSERFCFLSLLNCDPTQAKFVEVESIATAATGLMFGA